MQFTALLMFAIASLATAAPAANSAGTFHITNFHTLTTNTYPYHSSVTTFNVTLNNYFTATCSIKNTDKSYVLCGAAPEQAYYAYIPESDSERILDLEFELSLPGKTTRSYGTKALSQPTNSFDVPAYAATTPA